MLIPFDCFNYLLKNFKHIIENGNSNYKEVYKLYTDAEFRNSVVGMYEHGAGSKLKGHPGT